jgi:hypothetical protein
MTFNSQPQARRVTLLQLGQLWLGYVFRHVNINFFLRTVSSLESGYNPVLQPHRQGAQHTHAASWLLDLACLR